MAQNNIAKLQDAMTDPMQYPRNLKLLNGLNHRTSLEGQLHSRSEKLFHDGVSSPQAASSPAVEFLELNNKGEGIGTTHSPLKCSLLTECDSEHKSTPISNARKLREHLKSRHAENEPDPIQRLM